MYDMSPESLREAVFATAAERTFTRTVGEADQAAAARLYLMDSRHVTGTVPEIPRRPHRIG
jgi:hypothetical protein